MPGRGESRTLASEAPPCQILSSSSTPRHPRGKARGAKSGLAELADFVEKNEAAPLAYHIYFDEDGTRMTVLQIHPDSASMELHMDVAHHSSEGSRTW